MERKEVFRPRDPISLIADIIDMVSRGIESVVRELDSAMSHASISIPAVERDTERGGVPSPSYPGQTPADYCLECLTRHYLKALGLLEEAERFSVNKGYITPEARRRIEMALKEVVTAEEDLGTRIDDPEIARIVDEIKAKQRAWRKKLWAQRLLTTETSIEKLREMIRDMEDIVSTVRRTSELYHSKYGACDACEKLAVEVAERFGASVQEVREAIYALASDDKEKVRVAVDKLKSIGALEYVKKRVEEVVKGGKEGGEA